MWVTLLDFHTKKTAGTTALYYCKGILCLWFPSFLGYVFSVLYNPIIVIDHRNYRHCRIPQVPSSRPPSRDPAMVFRVKEELRGHRRLEGLMILNHGVEDE